MNQTLKEKQEELARLTKEAQEQHQQNALEIAKNAVTGDNAKLFHEAITFFFTERVQNVKLITASDYAFTMNNRYEGGGHDRGVIAKIFLSDDIIIEWRFGQYKTAGLYVNDKLLESSFTFVDFEEKEEEEYFSKQLTLLFGEEFAQKLIPVCATFFGVFFGHLEAFLAQCARVMFNSPIQDQKPPKWSILRKSWGELYS